MIPDSRRRVDIVADDLLDLIRSEYRVGSILPTYKNLEPFISEKVSAATIATALKIIMKMGYVAKDYSAGHSGRFGRIVVVEIPGPSVKAPSKPDRRRPNRVAKYSTFYSQNGLDRSKMYLLETMMKSQVGDRLPSLRSISAHLGVSVGQAQGGYRDLIDRGMVESHSTSYVLAKIPKPGDHPLMDVDRLTSHIEEIRLVVSDLEMFRDRMKKLQ